MSKNIISIGFEIPAHSSLHESYLSNKSLLDSDIILFQVNELREYSTMDDYQGKTCYNENGSFQLMEDSAHWRKELSTALEIGKTVFVFFSQYSEFYIHTGQKQFSGTGRNRQTTNIVTSYHNYHFSPIKLPTIIPRGGEKLIFINNPIFSTFWKEFENHLHYESYIDEKIDNPLFTTKTGNKVVGGLFKVAKGNLVLLPPIKYDTDKFISYNETTGEGTWTEVAVEFGKRFVKVIVDIDNSLRGQTESTPPPTWASNTKYELPEETDLKDKIKKLSEGIEQLTLEKIDTLSTLRKETLLRGLLFEKGKPLENAIIEALKVLEYDAENYDDGTLELDQVILSPEKDRFIGEAEGKDNSAVNIDKLRQLTTNIQEDLEREEVTEPAIGILFGNGYRLNTPEDREEQFTEKCIKTAGISNHILIRTLDLFEVAKIVKATKNMEFAKQCREAIKNSRGKIVDFPSLTA